MTGVMPMRKIRIHRAMHPRVVSHMVLPPGDWVLSDLVVVFVFEYD